METYAELYKQWSGDSHQDNYDRQIHDSLEMTDFAMYCFKEKIKCIQEEFNTYLNNILKS